MSPSHEDNGNDESERRTNTDRLTVLMLVLSTRGVQLIMKQTLSANFPNNNE